MSEAKNPGANAGVVELPGEGFPIKADVDLQNYLDRLRRYPVHIGCTWLPIWQIHSTVDDAEAFMTRYMQFIEQMMTTELIDIFARPTFLPVPIARLCTQLWTPKRVDHIIDVAKSRKLAIDINEVAQVPDQTVYYASAAGRPEVQLRHRQPQPERDA